MVEEAPAVPDEAPTLVAGEAAAEEAAAESSPDEPAGEQTAITMVEKADDGVGPASEETATDEPASGDAPGAKE